MAAGGDPFTYTLAQSADRGPLDDWADGRIRAAAAAHPPAAPQRPAIARSPVQQPPDKRQQQNRN